MKLYKMYITIILNRMFQYKYSLFLAIIGQVLITISGFLGVFFLMDRFHMIIGYTTDEVILCFSITLLAYSFAECFFRGFDQFNKLLQSGDFDRFLLRPRSLIIQILGSRFEITRVGRILQSIVLMIYVISTKSVISWTILNFLLLCMMMISGTILFACLFIIQASLTFYTIENIEIFNILTDGIREFGKYPVNVYGDFILKIMTFLVPFALIQYYPFLLLIGKSTNFIYMLFPIFALFFIIPTYLAWIRGVRNYSSAGS